MTKHSNDDIVAAHLYLASIGADPGAHDFVGSTGGEVELTDEQKRAQSVLVHALMNQSARKRASKSMSSMSVLKSLSAEFLSCIGEVKKSNDDAKDYQGRNSSGQFGSGTSGRDAKEQELLERDQKQSGADKDTVLSDIYKNYETLSYQEIRQKVSDHLSAMPKDQAIKEVRSLGISQPIASRRQAIEIATRKIIEMKESFDRTAVIRNAKPATSITTKLGFEVKDHDIPPGGDPRFHNLSVEPKKMSMVHGKKDELSSGLSKRQVGKK